MSDMNTSYEHNLTSRVMLMPSDMNTSYEGVLGQSTVALLHITHSRNSDTIWHHSRRHGSSQEPHVASA